MSTAKFDNWLNSDGTTNYKCRAWVNFNGTGTVAIRASGNVSSITDNGTGDYTVNFTTAMSDANYAVSTSTQRNSAGGGTLSTLYGNTSPTQTSSSVRVNNYTFAAAFEDPQMMSVICHR